MKHLSPRAAAEKEWKRLKRLCTASVRRGTAFLVDEHGELVLFEERPILEASFGLAWQARRRVEMLCAQERSPVPRHGISFEYREWAALDSLAEVLRLCSPDPTRPLGASDLTSFAEDDQPGSVVVQFSPAAW